MSVSSSVKLCQHRSQEIIWNQTKTISQNCPGPKACAHREIILSPKPDSLQLKWYVPQEASPQRIYNLTSFPPFSFSLLSFLVTLPTRSVCICGKALDPLGAVFFTCLVLGGSGVEPSKLQGFPLSLSWPHKVRWKAAPGQVTSQLYNYLIPRTKRISQIFNILKKILSFWKNGTDTDRWELGLHTMSQVQSPATEPL